MREVRQLELLAVEGHESLNIALLYRRHLAADPKPSQLGQQNVLYSRDGDGRTGARQGHRDRAPNRLTFELSGGRKHINLQIRRGVDEVEGLSTQDCARRDRGISDEFGGQLAQEPRQITATEVRHEVYIVCRPELAVHAARE